MKEERIIHVGRTGARQEFNSVVVNNGESGLKVVAVTSSSKGLEVLLQNNLQQTLILVNWDRIDPKDVRKIRKVIGARRHLSYSIKKSHDGRPYRGLLDTIVELAPRR